MFPRLWLIFRFSRQQPVVFVRQPFAPRSQPSVLPPVKRSPQRDSLLPKEQQESSLRRPRLFSAAIPRQGWQQGFQEPARRPLDPPRTESRQAFGSNQDSAWGRNNQPARAVLDSVPKQIVGTPLQLTLANGTLVTGFKAVAGTATLQAAVPYKVRSTFCLQGLFHDSYSCPFPPIGN